MPGCQLGPELTGGGGWVTGRLGSVLPRQTEETAQQGKLSKGFGVPEPLDGGSQQVNYPCKALDSLLTK